MVDDLRAFYNERIYTEGMNTFDQLTLRERFIIEQTLSFSLYKLDRSIDRFGTHVAVALGMIRN